MALVAEVFEEGHGPMKVTDFNLLKKLMGMTQSDNDQEALTAIRKANAILVVNKVNWDAVFSRLVSVDVESVEQFTDKMSTASEDVNKAGRSLYIHNLLSEAAENARGTFIDFVASLTEQFEARGTLSAGQIDALERSVQRTRREGHR